MYFFLDVNEAMDVASDRGDTSLRPPLSDEHKERMAAGKPSIIKMPMHMVEFIKGIDQSGL